MEISSVDVDFESSALFSLPEEPVSIFHKDIFVPMGDRSCLDRPLFLRTELSALERRTESAARGDRCASMKVGGSGEIGGIIEWGGEKGIEVSGYGKGSVHDDKGNSASVTVEQNSDGTGSARVSGKHSEDFD